MVGPILLIDDDVDVRTTLRQFLTQEGFAVQAAHDGQQALRLLERMDPPALILLDYRMPVMNGKQFLTELRRIPRFSQTPVVLMTAWTREWSGAQLQVSSILSKPIDLERLLAAVTIICGEGRPRPPQAALDNA